MPQNNALRQARYRDRRDRELAELREATGRFVDVFQAACERGRCYPIIRGLPDDPAAALAELAKRLEAKRLIVCQLEGGPDDRGEGGVSPDG